MSRSEQKGPSSICIGTNASIIHKSGIAGWAPLGSQVWEWHIIQAGEDPSRLQGILPKSLNGQKEGSTASLCSSQEFRAWGSLPRRNPSGLNFRTLISQWVSGSGSRQCWIKCKSCLFQYLVQQVEGTRFQSRLCSRGSCLGNCSFHLEPDLFKTSTCKACYFGNKWLFKIPFDYFSKTTNSAPSWWKVCMQQLNTRCIAGLLLYKQL